MPGLIRAIRDLLTRLLSRRRMSGDSTVPAKDSTGCPPATPPEGTAPGEDRPGSGECLRPVVPAKPVPLPPEGQPGLSRWKVRESERPAFGKVGRIFLEGDALVIRTDRDPRCFSLPLDGAAAVLAGDSRAILLPTGDAVGTARLSASGRAVNFLIGPVLYTTPRARITDVLEGRARKAAVFAGEAPPGDRAGQ